MSQEIEAFTPRQLLEHRAQLDPDMTAMFQSFADDGIYELDRDEVVGLMIDAWCWGHCSGTITSARVQAEVRKMGLHARRRHKES